MKPISFRFLTIWLLIVWVVVTAVLYANLGSPIRFAVDDNDLSVYFKRGEWVDIGGVPYRDVLSEYPQVPTYMFGFFRLLTTGDLGVRFRVFSAIFSFSMLLVLLTVLYLLNKQHLKNPSWVLVLLLPASIYFTINRFDIMPGLIVLATVLFAQKRQWLSASAILAVGFLTKWYPVLLFPILWSFQYRLEKKINVWMPVPFALIVFAGILPTYLAGGWKAVLVPYTFHAGRDLETISIPLLINLIIHKVTGINVVSIIKWMFLILQVILSPIGFFSNIDNDEKFLRWNIVIIIGFILFSSIFSPQWILWVSPLLILGARNRKDIVLLAAWDVITYLTFPIFWDTIHNFFIMVAIGVIRHALTTLILFLNLAILYPGIIEKFPVIKRTFLYESNE